MSRTKNANNMSSIVRKAIRTELTKTQGNIKAPELKKLIEDNFPDEPIYSLRTYQTSIRKYRDKFLGLTNETNKKDLDEFWAVSQWDDGLLPGAVDKLLEIQNLLMSKGHQLTKRRGYLIARIDVSSLEEKLRNTYPSSDMQNLVLLQISGFYALEEQMAEDDAEWKPGDPRVHADTSTQPDAKSLSLDQIFLINKDVKFETILSKWIELYAAPIRSKFKGKSVGYRKEQDLYDFINAIIQDVDSKRVASLVDKPELMELALRWMTLSTRDDLINPAKYEVWNVQKRIFPNI